MKTTNTFTATISVGLRERYDGDLHPIEDIERICQKYVDKIGWCVSVTPTKFIYKNGNEPGALIGIIDYPRFPTDHEIIEKRSIQLAKLLMKALNQFRVTVIFQNKTVMLEMEEALPMIKEV